MFWIFRKKGPTKPATYYLDVAAGIMHARGKSEGRMQDDWGRVDVLGAIRIAVWGASSWYKLERLSGRHLYWEKYDEVKMLMHDYLHAYHPDFSDVKGCTRNYQAVHLQAWSDTNTVIAVVELMRRAAKRPVRPLSGDAAPTQGV